MHFIIDILAAIILLFFILSGWRKGLLLSALGLVRLVLAYSMAFFAGRYIGFWLGEIIHRPRIMTIPVVAGLTFVIISFTFHIVMSNIKETHQDKEEKEDYRHPWYNALGGSIINLSVGLFSLVLLFWLGELFLLGISGTAIPGSAQSHFGRFTQRTVYEVVILTTSRKGHESQNAAMARMLSNPAQGIKHLENIIDADSVQQLLKDKQFATDLLSGDPAQIQNNTSLQQLFNDPTTLNELKQIGLLSGKEKKSILCKRLSHFGNNKTIQASIESLMAKNLLSTDKIILLIRDPDFDVIIEELLK